MDQESIFDVVIVGGGFAGLSAGLQIARARRSVLTIDNQEPRNRFVSNIHSVFGFDGQSRESILTTARNQLAAYPTASFLEGEATSITGTIGAFDVALSGGRTVRAARIILAVGVSDMLPDIRGLSDRWGHSALHCPYCHGYEVKGERLGVLATSSVAPHQAEIVRDWGKVTMFLNDGFHLDGDAHAKLAGIGIAVEPSPLVEISGPDREISHAVLKDGRKVELDALFLAPETKITTPLFKQLGCETDAGLLGDYISCDEWQATSVPGVYAAGDAAAGWTNASVAIASGVTAGVGAHQSFLT